MSTRTRSGNQPSTSSGGGSGGDPPRQPTRLPASLLLASSDQDLRDWIKRILAQIIAQHVTMNSLAVSNEFLQDLATRITGFVHQWISSTKTVATTKGAVMNNDGLLPLTVDNLRFGLARLLGAQRHPEVLKAIGNAAPSRSGPTQEITPSCAVILALGLPYLPLPNDELAKTPGEIGRPGTDLKLRNWSLSERSFRTLPDISSRLGKALSAVGVHGYDNHPPMMLIRRLLGCLWACTNDEMWFAAVLQFLLRRILLTWDSIGHRGLVRSYATMDSDNVQFLVDQLPEDLRFILQILELSGEALTAQQLRAARQDSEISSTEDSDPQPPKRPRRQ